MMRFIRKHKIKFLSAGVLALLVGYVGWRRLVEYSAVNVSYISSQEPRFSLMVDAYENLQGVLAYRQIARTLVQGKTNDIEKITTLNTWSHNHVRSIYTRFPAGVVDDNFYNILRRGHGYCDQIAHVFATLGYFAGYKTRLFMLKNPQTGASPHTLAQVWIDNQWRFVEPYLGIVPLTSRRQLVSMQDLEREPGLLINYYAQSGVLLSFSDFPQGNPFYTFPYIGVDGFIKKVFSRRWINHTRVIEPPGDGVKKKTPAPRVDKELVRLTVLYDNARRLHLDGRWPQAQQLYAQLLSQNAPEELREEALFFYAFALYEAGNFTDAIRSWDQLITSRPDSLWTPSSHYFAGECYLTTGEIEKARARFRSADTPLARLRYLRLSPPTELHSQTSGLYMP